MDYFHLFAVIGLIFAAIGIRTVGSWMVARIAAALCRQWLVGRGSHSRIT